MTGDVGAVANIPDGELWAEHNAAKRQMFDLVRERRWRS